MNAAWLMLCDIPIMCVTVDNCFYLTAGHYSFHEFGGIHKTGCVIVELRIVMHQHNGRFVRTRIQFLREPVELGRAEFAWRAVSAVERIQLEPVHAFGRQHCRLPVQRVLLSGGIRGKSRPEMIAIIMIAK